LSIKVEWPTCYVSPFCCPANSRDHVGDGYGNLTDPLFKWSITQQISISKY